MTLPTKHRKQRRDLANRQAINHTATLPLPSKNRNKSTPLHLSKPDANMNTTPLPLPKSQKVPCQYEEVEGKFICL